MRSSIKIFFSVLFVSSFWSPTSNGQESMGDSGFAGSWIDSVFNEMSISDKVNQLLLVEYEADAEVVKEKSMGYGGIKLNERSPHAYLKKSNQIKEQQELSPLVIHNLGDPLGLDMDSVDHFWNHELFEYIYEPHLYYEVGTAIGNQCKKLGIDALMSTEIDSEMGFGNDYWKFSEIDQGLSDRGLIPVHSLEIFEYDSNSQSTVIDSNTWDMIQIKRKDLERLHRYIRELIASDQLEIGNLETKCKTILNYKWKILQRGIRAAPQKNVLELFNNPNNLLLKEELAKYFLSDTKEESGEIPIKKLEEKRIAHLSFGSEMGTIFNEYANKYTQVDLYKIGVSTSKVTYSKLLLELLNYDLIICTFYYDDELILQSGFQEEFIIFQGQLKKFSTNIFIIFSDNDDFQYSDVLIRDNSWFTNKLAAEYVFGGIEVYGQIDANNMPYGERQADEHMSLKRFSYTWPEAVGLNSEVLSKIDSIATYAIRSKAAPGCQILVAKDNKVVYQKSFGYHTYDSIRKVKNADLYDLASITKVSGALPALMKLYEEGKFDLDATMGTYLRYFRRGNKKKLTYREILAHQSGLTPYIVYWKTAMRKKGKYKRKTIRAFQDEEYPYELSPGLYLHKDYKRKIYREIRKSKVGEKQYLYSGLTFLLYPEIIETISGQEYVKYLNQNFYKPLGATSLTYNPKEKYNPEHITPTEYDSLFRKSQIHGKVHDEAAAMMEGISSNAGLFANANDLAKLFQMYCNYGSFGSRQYINEETIIEFSRCQYPENNNRRGLGFDRPLPEPHENGNTAKSVSQRSFGHSGFTGTFAWADPEYNLVYIFLSNRVYPTRENRKLYEMNIRTDIQEVIYEAMRD